MPQNNEGVGVLETSVGTNPFLYTTRQDGCQSEESLLVA